MTLLLTPLCIDMYVKKTIASYLHFSHAESRRPLLDERRRRKKTTRLSKVSETKREL